MTLEFLQIKVVYLAVWAANEHRVLSGSQLLLGVEKSQARRREDAVHRVVELVVFGGHIESVAPVAQVELLQAGEAMEQATRKILAQAAAASNAHVAVGFVPTRELIRQDGIGTSDGVNLLIVLHLL